MSYKVDNAIILAAGMSSRFAPISQECPKGLLCVKGEVLIERQIRQLQEVGIQDVIIVVGYMKERFMYLQEKYGVKIIENTDYSWRNNNSSIYAAKEYLNNTYICSSDNYFEINPFEKVVEESYYATVYSEDRTEEWCVEQDENDWIKNVSIGGCQKWYMLGHVFWSNEFSCKFRRILEDEYEKPETKNKFWENIYIDHIDELKLKIRKYPRGYIYEFDSLDELREFDSTYYDDSRSYIIKYVSKLLKCEEKDIVQIEPEKDYFNSVLGFRFKKDNRKYLYIYKTKELKNESDR